MAGLLVLPLDAMAPRIAPDVYLAPGAVVVGDVEIGPGSSVWFNATIRGDVAPIRIGARSHVQDNAVLHVDAGPPCLVGDDVTIGHGAIVHGTTIGNGVTIGMGAVVLSRSRVGAGAIVAAGAVVPEGREFPPHSLIVGLPAKRVGGVSEEQAADIARGASEYVERAAAHRESLAAGPRFPRFGRRLPPPPVKYPGWL